MLCFAFSSTARTNDSPQYIFLGMSPRFETNNWLNLFLSIYCERKEVSCVYTVPHPHLFAFKCVLNQPHVYLSEFSAPTTETRKIEYLFGLRERHTQKLGRRTLTMSEIRSEIMQNIVNNNMVQ